MARCVECMNCRTRVTLNNVGLRKTFWCRLERFTPIEYTTRQISTPHSFVMEHHCPDFEGDDAIVVPECPDPSILQIVAHDAPEHSGVPKEIT